MPVVQSCVSASGNACQLIWQVPLEWMGRKFESFVFEEGRALSTRLQQLGLPVVQEQEPISNGRIWKTRAARLGVGIDCVRRPMTPISYAYQSFLAMTLEVHYLAPLPAI